MSYASNRQKFKIWLNSLFEDLAAEIIRYKKNQNKTQTKPKPSIKSQS